MNLIWIITRFASHNNSKLNCHHDSHSDDEEEEDECLQLDDSSAETEHEFSDADETADHDTSFDSQEEAVLPKIKTKWFICLIGLPACGKSTVVKHLCQYVKEKTEGSYRIQPFNAGDVRRKYEKLHKAAPKFDFNFNNEDSTKLRDLYAFEALKDLSDALISDRLDIGIFDATNSTIKRRHDVFAKIKEVSKSSGVRIHPLILEVKCKNNSMRRFNMENKANNNDYKNIPKDVALTDFFDRARKYEAAYQPVTVEEINKLGAKYFCISNAGEQIYYDCGVKHHDCKTHEDVKFKSAVMNVILSFLVNYRACWYKWCFFIGFHC
ncbi:unnamed protein product [Ambrosiozyma monospora]|uniref:Unnamed protein product n=1 Tax=Ambrosiozyma monospora TaxID=43982 RepID=A0ACB5TK70_AMBMO|nr:unnamed protein product [Ambrosiozyma monospora]